MNKIFKVIYSKTRHCYVVVSELAKSHCKTTVCPGKSKTALTAAVLLALGTFSFVGMPGVAYAAIDDPNPNSEDLIGVNQQYTDKNGETKTYGVADLNDHKNWNGRGAHGIGAITIGIDTEAATNTIAIGERNASASQKSVYIGAKYDANNQVYPSSGTNVVSVGYGSDAAGTGSIAIGSGAAADTFDNAGHGTNPDKSSQSIAIGYNAKAKQNNIAIGAGSIATDKASTTAAAFTNQEASKSYVSVGDGKKDSDTQYRRITNVADGAADSDVATIRQLKALSDKAGVYNEGWGIKIADEKDDNGNVTKKNAISVDRNLGTNLDTTGHVHLDVSKTGLVLGTVVNGAPGTDVDLHYGATGDYAVTVGGGVNTASGKASVVIGGSGNTASDEAAVSSGGSSNVASGSMAAVYGGFDNEASGTYASIFAGAQNKATKTWSTVGGGSSNNATEDYASIWGGQGNTASATYASVYGGGMNSAIGNYAAILGGTGNSADMGATVTGGSLNNAQGLYSSITGGTSNTATGAYATALGGRAGNVNGIDSVGILGGSTGENAPLTLAAGYQSVVTDTGVKTTSATLDEFIKYSEMAAEGKPVSGFWDTRDLDNIKRLDNFATALGYQATADESQTIAFGHDANDVSGYKITWKQRTDGQYNSDGTQNDYTQAPEKIEETHYDTAYYNRLVKAADGIEDHDAVVMEQLKNASDVGSNIKVYKTDENGNVQFDKDNKPIEDTSDAAKTKKEAAQKASEDAWGSAIGTGKVVDPNAKDKDSNGSGQLVTGGTVYNALQQQKTDLTDALSVNAGWGIDVDKTKNNTISVKHNLSSGDSAYADTDATGLILGGSIKERKADKKYGAATASSVIVGAQNALASNDNSVVVGGLDNVASGANSTVVGGDNNKASGNQSAVFGGRDNTASGIASTAGGGIMNVASGQQATAIGGYSNYALGTGSTSVGGYGKDYGTGHNSSVNGSYSVAIAGGSTGTEANYSLAAGRQAVVTTENGTAIGYQATTDEANTIAFGHDKGDVSGYTVTWKQLPNGQTNADGTSNDYTKAPTVKKTTYDSAAYNRLVKVADGVEDHDVVVMEQLKNASDVGSNIKVYKTDENGNVQFDGNNKPIEDRSDAAKTKQKDSKDAWGKALGAGTFTTGTDTTPTNASTSDQLVTGKTLYDYDKPTGSQNYVNVNNTTGQNLSALDAQVKANADALTKPNHNIKYYSVTAGPSLGYTQYTNENNDGAKGTTASLAAGNVTHTDGVASTVVGSYSAVFGTGLQGAAALSYGTVNVNNNTDTTKAYSGVANSLVGQANMTTNSNAAIIYGAGNTVTNSYRDIDKDKAEAILNSTGNAEQLKKALQDAVPTSGGQVMVMGGGNNVDSAYMTQVVGVGNTVKGNQVKNAKGEWVTDTSDAAINDYNAKESSQYNYVDGFNNEVINGKHDYVIGANNTVTGDSYDDKAAKKYSNESNIIFGDNHTVTNTKNAVIIGSSDTQMTLDKGDNATAIGHNASAQRDALAVGVNTEARGNAVALGTYSTAHNNSIAIGTKATAVSSQNLAIGWEAHIGNIKTDDEKIKNAIALGSDSQVSVNDLLESDKNRGVLSIGAKNKERRIIHVRAGVNDTDAVNVSQLKSVQNDLTDTGLTFAANEGNDYTAKLGSKVTIQGTAKKENHEYTADNLTTEIDKDGNITILMDKDMSVEKLAVNGKPGTPGSIGIKGQDGDAGIGIDGKNGISIKGRDGQDGVTIKAVDGKNGTEGHIGLTGPAGTNGKDGTNAVDITVKNGYDGANGINGKNGVDGTSLTRIVYTDKTGEHQVATMEDGMKYAGDDAQKDATKAIAKKLNNTLDIIGGADSKNLTEGNIGVNSTTDGKLKVQLAKDLTGLNSATYTTTTGEGESATTSTTVVNGNGLTITNGPSITNNGIDGGSKTITNVGSGADASGKYTNETKNNAANIGDVQNIAGKATTDLTNKGLIFAANDGADYTAKLGSKVTIQGSAKKADHEYTSDNLTTKIDENGNITILMDKNMSLENLAVNGKDGKDGQPGTAGSIGIKGQDGKDGISIDGKDGISIKGKDGKDGVTIKAVDGKNGTEGHIGLTGPAGTNGKDGTNAIDITVKNGYDDAAKGINGTNGVDGKDGITRIVYTDKTGEHQVATMEDGLKFKGDDGKEIAKKLNNTLDIIGGAKGELTEGNIGVISKDGKLNVQLAKDLTGLNSTTYTTTTGEGSTTVVNGNGLTITNGPSITNNGVDAGNKTITNVGSGIDKDSNGKYTVTDQNKGNAANIGDVQNIVNDAKQELTNGENGLNSKANVDASNIGANLTKNADGTVATEADKKANAEKWGKAIGTGEIKAGDKRLVTGDTVYAYNKPVAEEGKTLNYVSDNKTTGQNLGALDSQVKTNADAISKISSDVTNLSDNAVQYDKDFNKTKVTLGGEGGTTITNVKDGALNDKSTDAVNGKQLYNEQQAREAADKAITEKVTNNTNEITKIKNGDFTDTSKTVIKNLAKDAVQIKAGTAITVDGKVDETTGNKTYTISANNNGKVAKDDGNLISGDTLYKEVHVDKDGSYIKGSNTVGQNLSALDTGLKTTSDLIHTNTKGDTIQIGGNSTATKIDVSGKDAKGNTTGRVITGVITDASDRNSAANVDYVEANTQQIYREMNNAYGNLNRNINRAAAGSNALAALHPLDYDPADKASFAVGYGHYRNANAAAIGAFYYPNANTMVNVGVSVGNGDPGINAGVSFKLGQGSAYNGVSKAEMAQTIHDQAAEISTIKANDAAKDKRIDALEKENQEMKKQIQEILARLNG